MHVFTGSLLLLNELNKIFMEVSKISKSNCCINKRIQCGNEGHRLTLIRRNTWRKALRCENAESEIYSRVRENQTFCKRLSVRLHAGFRYLHYCVTLCSALVQSTLHLKRPYLIQSILKPAKADTGNAVAFRQFQIPSICGVTRNVHAVLLTQKHTYYDHRCTYICPIQSFYEENYYSWDVCIPSQLLVTSLP